MSSIGTLGNSAASQLLAQLQQKLLSKYVAANSPDDAGQSTATNTSGTPSSGGILSDLLGGPSGGSSQVSTGSSLTSFGPGMLNELLSYLESQTTSSGTPDATSATATTDGTASGSGTDANANPVAQALFSAIDTNGDGTISQSELESAFAANGGTGQSADSLYSQIASASAGGGAGGITDAQFAASLPSSAPSGQAQLDGTQAPGGKHHHHHHGGSSGSDPLAALLDTNTSGSTDGDTTQAAASAGGSSSNGSGTAWSAKFEAYLAQFGQSQAGALGASVSNSQIDLLT